MPYPVAAVRGKGLVAASSFIPPNMSSLIAWIDFSDVSTLYQSGDTSSPVTADGQTIGYATDKSGKGNHAIQSTSGSRPLYKTNIQNGKSVSRYDGSDDVLLISTWSYTLTAETTFIVFSQAAVGTFQRIFTQKDDANPDFASGYIPVIEDGGTTNFGSFADGSARSIITSTGAMKLFVSSHSGSAITNRINGVNGSPYSHTLNKAFTKSAIGGRYEAVGANLNGDIAEILCYSSLITGAAFTEVENYLNTKWVLF